MSSQFHLTYCTNVHAAESWEDTFSKLKEYLPRVKAEVSPENSMGVGLRLSEKASRELGLGQKLLDFMNWLSEEDLYVFTMNGFPYGNFHFQEVKDMVHAPDWTTKERMKYTLRLFRQLVNLLPEGMSGGISTSPVSYKYWHSSDDLKDKTFKKAAYNMAKLVGFLYRAECETGRYMHLDIEPEPDGMLENSNDVVHFFREFLFPVATEYLCPAFFKTRGEAEEMVLRYINVCYDVCHFALAYESPTESFRRFEQTGIRVGKIQLSSALRIIMDDSNREERLEQLLQFDEQVYLHQVTELQGEKVRTYPDLSVIKGLKNNFLELRAHFHVPVYLDYAAGIPTTQHQLWEVLQYLKCKPDVCDHLEVETYTWNVSPRLVKEGLRESIIREISWVQKHINGADEKNRRS